MATRLKAQPRPPVIKEWLKGLAALPTVLAGCYLMWAASQERFNSYGYWLGTIAGLLIFCFALAFAVEFGKRLITGELTSGLATAVRENRMPEWVKMFLALIGALGGAVLCIGGLMDARGYRGGFYPSSGDVISIVTGIVLIAGGVTYFSMRGKGTFHG